MIPVVFEKAKAQAFLDALVNGRSIERGDAWTHADMLTLAGACMFAVLSHGPARLEPLPPDLHHEHREALDVTLFADVHGAIEWCAHLAQKVHDGEFDAAFGERVVAILDGASKALQPVEGFRAPDSAA